jgi:regulator of cell morphogenesis and NO signaling
MIQTTDTTIRDIVADNYRTAAVLQRFGIDFCCGGNRSLAEACRELNLDDEAVVRELDSARSAQGEVPRFNSWALDFLADYIVANHHAYLRAAMPTISAHTTKTAEVHGSRHPELIKIAAYFSGLWQELSQHMEKEEHILFPAIKGLAAAEQGTGPATPAPFGSVAGPIRVMEREHEGAGDAIHAIRALSRDFALPDDACATYRVTFKELQEFEADLLQHVHLENNILFPRAIELERQLLGA